MVYLLIAWWIFPVRELLVTTRGYVKKVTMDIHRSMTCHDSRNISVARHPFFCARKTHLRIATEDFSSHLAVDWPAAHLQTEPFGCKVVPHSDVSWFINPMNTIDISAINHSYGSYKPTSLDWFCWENLQETHGFLPSNIGLSGSNFPIIQFYDISTWLREYPHNSYGLKNATFTYLHFSILEISHWWMCIRYLNMRVWISMDYLKQVPLGPSPQVWFNRC